MNDIPSRYNPKETEDKWYKFWEGNSLFAAKPNPAKRPFCIVIPPPNVTGRLHMGHALNNTIQDILNRYHRMKGEESLWMPGTDHAGIATQNVVEKEIAKQGLKRQDLGREKFVERVWQWREQYGSTIIHQLKKLGASCDWQRMRFTMDEEYSKAVLEVFVKLYENGLIYQGSYIINWCPRCQTALSDEEAPHKELQGNLYYLRYPFKESQVASHKPQVKKPATCESSRPACPERSRGATCDYIIVATTRPETMLGDTAVAVNPKDKRYKNLIGKVLILPLINREIKIIADSIVDMKFGTGAVKVTPSHDPNDYILGKKHNLEFVNVMYPDGRMNENAGGYKDMDRFQAREVILEDLKEKGLLEKVLPHQLSAGHCYRCNTIIEPYLSKQWFVKMKPLAKPAIEVVKIGKIKFYPKRWTKVYLNWMENIHDWCISRQIWWGHRLPVYYCKKCQGSQVASHTSQVKRPASPRDLPAPSEVEGRPATNAGIIVSRIRPEKCPICGASDIYQDEDVLDTWFSSWLWPFATFYWPNLAQSSKLKAQSKNLRAMNYELRADLGYFYPTSVLVTAPEIIFFWVARMIMAGLKFMEDIPFKDVYIHGTVRDIEGKKMSKSLGNIIDPLDIINDYGADALRFSLISITAQGQDVFLSKERFEQGRNFANKIWNASRFILMNLEPENTRADLCTFFKKENFPPSADQPTAEDIVNRWILSRFYSVLKEVNKMLDTYRFNEAANTLYGFFWHEFCDWYLELAKPILVNREQRTENRDTQLVMYKVLEKFLRVLHPFMPFVTEEIWQRLNGLTGQQDNGITSIMVQAWPHIQEQMIDKKLEKNMEAVFELITKIRELKTLIEIESKEDFVVDIKAHNKATRDLVQSNIPVITKLAGLFILNLMDKNDLPKSPISTTTKEFIIYLRFTGSFDPTIIKNKIKNKIDKLSNIIKAKEIRLNNRDFLKKAPKDVVASERENKQELGNELKELEKIFNGLCQEF